MTSLLIAASAAIASATLCVVLLPLLLRYALARPNARSSHTIPTPQGGGIAVLGGCCLALALGLALTATPGRDIAIVMGCASLLALVGAWDDIRPLPASVRLALQGICVGLVLVFAAPGLRLFPELMPVAVERGLALLAGVWFVNLTNFMDGLDWLTVAGLVPLLGALAISAGFGLLDPATAWIAAGLCGGLLGFAPFNRPVARLFLGDVGSLPIGLITAYLLYRLAGEGALAAALILPLYHITDATLTLIRRLARGERVWEAHRSHFYQQATTNGHKVMAVVGAIALLNGVLIALAAWSVLAPGLSIQLVCLSLALLFTALLLRHFSRPSRHHG